MICAPAACPAGRYGASDRLTDGGCDGACALGHYCPKGSTSATQRPCPAGRYGNATGLATRECSAACARGACAEALCAPGYEGAWRARRPSGM